MLAILLQFSIGTSIGIVASIHDNNYSQFALDKQQVKEAHFELKLRYFKCIHMSKLV